LRGARLRGVRVVAAAGAAPPATSSAEAAISPALAPSVGAAPSAEPVPSADSGVAVGAATRREARSRGAATIGSEAGAVCTGSAA
jgi:hypothetical protein